jgi:hypothetical protein
MSLIHAVGGRTTHPQDTRGEKPCASTGADHEACLERIHELREENEVLRKSAEEFAALAERLQGALVIERAKTTREGSAGRPGNRPNANHVLTISMQIEAEFRAIPNLRLTKWQAARLWDLDQGECDEAIAALVRKRVLRETPGGFVRRDR